MGKRPRLYIAYGSNLNLSQMAYRCPTAKVAGKGGLKGYELLFRGGRRGCRFRRERRPQNQAQKQKVRPKGRCDDRESESLNRRQA